MSPTIACRLTAALPSAIATIAIRGPKSLEIVRECLDSNLTENQWTVGRIRFARWPIQCSAEHVVVCRIDERTLEIHCHGGVAVSNAILADLQLQGCLIVEQSTWSQPDSNSSAADKIKYLCNQHLIQATSERAAGILLDQANGALLRFFESLDQHLEAQQWGSAKSLIDEVSQWNELGLHLIEPWRVVLAGPPNVGKSSLINALSGQIVAIVHHEAGTTRDWIEAHTQIDGWPVSLTDTAGLRLSEDMIEREGVQRAKERIRQADLVVVVADASIGWNSLHDEILTLCQLLSTPPRIVIAWNKSDLQPSSPFPESIRAYDTVRCSAENSISPLLELISRSLVPVPPIDGQPVVFSLQHQRTLKEMQSLFEIPIAPNSASELKLKAQQLLHRS